MHKLDHIVFGANTLEKGTKFVENIFQAKLSDIGYHNDMGTHNRVIKISDEVYLEVVAIDPNMENSKYRRWFNLDNPNLQLKLEKSPQIIGYVIEKNDRIPLKYYNPFFNASRSNYRWQFSMPNYRNNILDPEIIETGIIPSLISWKSEKPINQMKSNQFELIKFEIVLPESQPHFNTFLKTFGDIKHVSVASKFTENAPIFKLKIKDKLRNMIVLL